MTRSLPSRPHLDHLRRQAKSLLAALAEADPAAIAAFQEHLPDAAGLDAAQVRAAGFRLADAQSVIARQTGFASWPRLGRHVDTLRALEGTWRFISLTLDGVGIPAVAIDGARLCIDGDRFRTESPEATYEGVFQIDVEADPSHLDIDFVAGPEAGQTNHGIFRLHGDTLELCLDPTGKGRPSTFAAAPGTGHAHEVLQRSSAARPAAVTGGTPPPSPSAAADAAPSAFAPTAASSPLLAELQGEWTAVEVVRDGQALPAAMLRGGRRRATGNEVQISFGGQVMIHALVRLDPSQAPVAVDYANLGGAAKGTQQAGIFAWRDGDACFCMAAPGQPRPTDFTSARGSGRTFSRWRRSGA